jgi:hypothetical protein
VLRGLEPEGPPCFLGATAQYPPTPQNRATKANKSNGINKKVGKVRNAKANLTRKQASKSLRIDLGCAKVREK